MGLKLGLAPSVRLIEATNEARVFLRAMRVSCARRGTTSSMDIDSNFLVTKAMSDSNLSGNPSRMISPIDESESIIV